MFKKFLKEILQAESKNDLYAIMYRDDGIDRSYQSEKISYKDYELLAQTIDKLCLYMQEV